MLFDWNIPTYYIGLSIVYGYYDFNIDYVMWLESRNRYIIVRMRLPAEHAATYR